MLCLEGVARREGVLLAFEEVRNQWGRAPGPPGCSGGPLLSEAKLQDLGLVWSRLLGKDILTQGFGGWCVRQIVYACAHPLPWCHWG